MFRRRGAYQTQHSQPQALETPLWTGYRVNIYENRGGAWKEGGLDIETHLLYLPLHTGYYSTLHTLLTSSSNPIDCLSTFLYSRYFLSARYCVRVSRFYSGILGVLLLYIQLLFKISALMIAYLCYIIRT